MTISPPLFLPPLSFILFIYISSVSSLLAVHIPTYSSNDRQRIPHILNRHALDHHNESFPSVQNISLNTPHDTTSEQSPLNTMYIETSKPGLGIPLTSTVFKDGSFIGLFNSCSTASVESQSGVVDDCFQDDPYNDRLLFKATYLSPGTLIQHAFLQQPPTLKSIGDAASPRITDAEVDPSASTAQLIVAYSCKSNSKGSIFLSLTLHFDESDNSTITIRWRKICESGINTQLSFGYLSKQKSDISATKNLFSGNDSVVPLIVAPSDVSTEVYIKLLQLGAQQVFVAPYVTSTNPDVTSVTVRGNHPLGGVLNGLEMTSFLVNYECTRKGMSDIHLSFAIPPFENKTASWKKDCGGKEASSLQVGTSLDGFDVVNNGKPTPRYSLGIDHIGTPHSEDHLHLSGNTSNWKVFLKNNDIGKNSPPSEESAIHIGRIAVTVEHPEILAPASPTLRIEGALGWKTIPSSQLTLQSGDSIEVSFHLICRKFGESRILISVPVLSYDTLEFGLAKECTHVGTSHKSRDLVLTVGSIFWGFTILVFAVLGIVCIRRCTTTGIGFKPVSTTER